MLVDTHCHIHESDYPLQLDEVMLHAAESDVGKMICVGTSKQSSEDAIELSKKYENLFASIGVHPHDTKDGWEKIKSLARKHTSKDSRLVAVGEVGLDYYYNHSPRDVQIKALEEQIQIALDNDLPIIFHVREAFEDFWPIFDNFASHHQIRGVLHSFTDTQENLDKAFERGLYVGVNGISTFTKDPKQQEMYANIPLERMLLETDAPFLSPVPHRGSPNEPSRIVYVAEHHAKLRNIDIDEVGRITTENAERLFRL